MTNAVCLYNTLNCGFALLPDSAHSLMHALHWCLPLGPVACMRSCFGSQRTSNNMCLALFLFGALPVWRELVSGVRLHSARLLLDLEQHRCQQNFASWPHMRSA